VTTVALLQELLVAIETAVATAPEGCEIDTYQVTAGTPAAPSGNCSQVSVWASSAFNSASSMFHEDNPCLVIRAVQLNWRLDLCYGETVEDWTPAQHLEFAVCFYGLADAIWCGLNSVIKSGELFHRRCGDLQVDPLTYTERLGSNASAESGMRMQDDCPAPVEIVDVVGALAGQQEGEDFG